MVAPVQPDKVRRAKQNGAERGRQRILELLADGPHGVEWLIDEAHMSRRTFWQRIREIGDQVVVKHQAKGCAMVGLRPR
jgi:hypothetical protein